MTRRSGLGKGLSSLIPAEGVSEGTEVAGAVFADVAVASVSPNPNQPRVHFDEESLVELAASIAEMGVLQPVLLRPVDDSRYELIAGERRWRAAQRVGLATIPAIIRTTDDVSSIEQALVENIHRRDLTPLEEAASYQQLLEDFGLTHDKLAERVGKSRSAITNTIRLLGLPPSVQHLLADGQLSAGHARALLSTPDRARQEELARRVVAEGWSVRAIEQELKPPTIDVAGSSDEAEQEASDDDDPGEPGGPDRGLDGAGLTPATRLRPPGLLELEQLLADHLDTRVAVTMGARRGRITVDFADLEDLERIYRQMTGA